jgi:hypothetical protein
MAFLFARSRPVQFFIVEHVEGQLGRKPSGCGVCSFTSRNSTCNQLQVC